MNISNKEYGRLTKKLSPPSAKVKDFLWAYIVGGLICVIGQLLMELYGYFGATENQILFKIQLPLAMPTILTGVNQVILLSLSMVVIASMVGARGLGSIVYQGIQQNDIAKGFESGLGIVILAIILDRITQAIANKRE